MFGDVADFVRNSLHQLQSIVAGGSRQQWTATDASCSEQNPQRRRHRMRLISYFRWLCVSLAILAWSSVGAAQSEKPDWCKALPRPEYKALERVLQDETWFEVYKVAPGTFAIYEPRQFEETISYLIVGTKQALLFDTGMGVGNIKAVVTRLTSRPVVVLNSHTHNAHVGGNWQSPFVFGMDSASTRPQRKGSPEYAQTQLPGTKLCG